MTGKIPPQAVDLEEAILGACLLERESLALVYSIVQVSSFYSLANQTIYRTMLSLMKQNIVVDILSVSQELKKINKLEEVGGAYYVSKLTDKASSNLERNCRILVQYEIKRKLIVLASKVDGDSFSELTDPFEIIDHTIQSLFALTTFKTTNKIKHIGEIHKAAMVEMREVVKSGKPSGVPSGIIYLDKLTNGWQKSDLIILAARPGMGKTCEALQFVKHPAYNLNIPVGMFSLEMSSKQLINRLQSSESFINVSKITTTNLDIDQLNAIDKDFVKPSSAPIYIDDTANLSIVEFRQKAKRMVIDYKVQLIVIDYLQLMSADVGKGALREQEISTISRGLKQTAKELERPIIALAQLSRAVESRGGNKKPQLSDLRESGAIEQDADMIIFGYRPEYYGFKEPYQYHKYTLDWKDLLINIIAKHRNGALGEIPMKFKGQFMRIENYVLEQTVIAQIVDENKDSPF